MDWSSTAVIETYEGEFILRFDDTDKSQAADARGLQHHSGRDGVVDRKKTRQGYFHASDRIEEYYSRTTTMLEEGFGYVCRCTADESRNSESKNELSLSILISDNLVFWKRMLDGKFSPERPSFVSKPTCNSKSCPGWPALRLRDTKLHPHPRRSGFKYVVWPLLDFKGG